MRNFFILLFSSLLVLVNAQTTKPTVLASASMWADMAKELGGDHINVDLIVPRGSDPHMYEPTPGDAKKVSDADLILINGLTFEGWINDLIANSGTEAETITITQYVTPISSDVYKAATDPHAWMDVRNGIKYCQSIHEAFVKLLPNKKEELKTLYDAYIKELEQLHGYINMSIASIPESQRVLITSHDAFKYFGDAYGVKLEAIQGISTEAEAQFSDMERVTDAIKKYKVPAIFIESTINPKMLKQIAEDNGVTIGGELFADSLGDENASSGTYIGMLKYNTDTIVRAMTQTKHEEIHANESPNLLIYVVLGLALLLILGFVFYKMN